MARSIRTLVLAVVASVLLVVAGPAQGTVLTFDIDNVSPSGSPAPNGGSMLTTHAAYGDNVNAAAMTSGSFVYNYGVGNGFTPNLAVAYSLGTGGTASTYYTEGDATPSPRWKDVNFLQGGAPAIHYYTLTTNSSDWGIQVNSFNVFGYNSNLNHTFQWKLRAGSTLGAILAQGGPVALTTSTIASPYVANTGMAPYAGTVVLELEHLVGPGGAWGFDNLNFDQVYLAVPEPSSFLALLGCAGLLLRSNRRRQMSNACAA